MNRIKSTFLFPLLTIALGILVPLIMFDMMLRLFPVSESPQRAALNAENPVPRFEPNRVVTNSIGWNFQPSARKRVNNAGFFSNTDYDSKQTTPLMAIIGDSFVAAKQVENAQTFHGILSAEQGESARIYPFGVGGAPLSTYLIYAKHAVEEYNADTLVFSIIENDFDQSFKQFKVYPSQGFWFIDDSPASTTPPLFFEPYETPGFIHYARYSAFIRYLFLNLNFAPERTFRLFRLSQEQNQDESVPDEYFEIAKKAIHLFFQNLPEMTKRSTQQIAFTLDADRPGMYKNQETEHSTSPPAPWVAIRKYFADYAEGLGYEVIDLQKNFGAEHAKSGAVFEFDSDPHWNVLGHQLAAQAIRQSATYTHFKNKTIP